ncbi:hypothetical protein JMJ78_0000889, partial [Colletotrichum scovillei]
MKHFPSTGEAGGQNPSESRASCCPVTPQTTDGSGRYAQSFGLKGFEAALQGQTA